MRHPARVLDQRLDAAQGLGQREDALVMSLALQYGLSRLPANSAIVILLFAALFQPERSPNLKAYRAARRAYPTLAWSVLPPTNGQADQQGLKGKCKALKRLYKRNKKEIAS